MGLEFTNDALSRVGLVTRHILIASPEGITIHIHGGKDADYTAALDAILTEDLAKVEPALPSYWKKFAWKYLLTTDPGAQEDDGDTTQDGVRKIGGAVTEPVVRKTVNPKFSPASRSLRYSATSILKFVIGTDGIPAKISILHPAGLGLDEAAVDAASQYRFTPAMQDGKPVAVQINLEVNFKIF